MSHYVALVNYTDKGIVNIKTHPRAWTGLATCCARWAASSSRST